MLALERFGGRVWSAPAYLPYVQPPLTDDAVAAAEQQLRVKLPSSYLTLLRQQNGGYIRGVHGVSHCILGIGPQFPSLTRDDAWWRPKRATDEIWIPQGSELLIPFDGDGHWDLCFDYRTSAGAPTVALISCESKTEEPVAATFDDYLTSLEDSLATTIRLYGDTTASAVARQLATKFSGPKPTSDSFAHGYTEWRVQMPGNSQWIWCTPNLVPAGFRREGRRVVLSEATALQMPEDPRCTVLISVTDESRESCLNALAKLELEVHAPPPSEP